MNQQKDAQLMNTITRLGAATLLTALGISALAGCSGIDDMIHKQETHTFEARSDFASDSHVDAAWIPTDATRITVRSAADRDTGIAVILVTSKDALPATCQQAERRSAPMLSIDDTPDIYDPKAGQVYVCDDWTVMGTADGWYGWTPNTEDHTG